MEDLFLSLPFFFLSFILFTSLILNASINRFRIRSTSKLPPGPWKFPIIGNIYNVIGCLPHHNLRKLSCKYGPLMHLKLGEMSIMVVSSAEVAGEVLKTHETTFAQRPRFIGADIVAYGCTNVSFSPYGGYWKQLRKICSLELLCPKRVRSFQSIREEEALNLMRYVCVKAGSFINLSEELFSMTYAITARAAFGEKCKDQKAFISLVTELMKQGGGFMITDLFPSQKWLHFISVKRQKVEDIHRKIDAVLENIIGAAMRKISEEGDADCLLFVLLNLKDHGTLGFPLTKDNVKAIILDMFIGGSETSSTTLEWAISEMLKNPRVLKRAQAEVRQVLGSNGYIDEIALKKLEYLRAVVKETLRLHPPGPLLLPRECGKTCEVNGYTIPAGATIFVNAWAIGRDPKYWSEAERFFPERFLNCPVDYKGSHFEFIPFGAGKRICPGMSFGVANIELPLALLLYYFDWELPFGTSHESLDMTESFGATVRRKNDLLLIPISYNTVPIM